MEATLLTQHFSAEVLILERQRQVEVVRCRLDLRAGSMAHRVIDSAHTTEFASNGTPMRRLGSARAFSPFGILSQRHQKAAGAQRATGNASSCRSKLSLTSAASFAEKSGTGGGGSALLTINPIFEWRSALSNTCIIASSALLLNERTCLLPGFRGPPVFVCSLSLQASFIASKQFSTALLTALTLDCIPSSLDATRACRATI